MIRRNNYDLKGSAEAVCRQKMMLLILLKKGDQTKYYVTGTAETVRRRNM